MKTALEQSAQEMKDCKTKQACQQTKLCGRISELESTTCTLRKEKVEMCTKLSQTQEEFDKITKEMESLKMKADLMANERRELQEKVKTLKEYKNRCLFLEMTISIQEGMLQISENTICDLKQQIQEQEKHHLSSAQAWKNMKMQMTGKLLALQETNNNR